MPTISSLEDIKKLEAHQIQKVVDSLPDSERKEFFIILKELDQRKFYQLNPMNWMVDVLSVDPETIKWSLYPEYKNKGYVDSEGGYTKEWDGTPDPVFSMIDALAKWKDVAVESGTALGKAQALDTPILTPRGWRMMGELKVGDYVIGSNGNPTKVIAIHPQGKKKLYRITFNDKSSTLCCDEHLWSIRTRKEKYLGRDYRTVPLKDFKNKLASGWQIPITEPIQYEEKDLPLDPYILGVLLGDGCLRGNVSFSTADEQILRDVERRLPEGVYITKQSGEYAYNIVTDRGKENPILNALRYLNVWMKLSYEKEIPEIYMRGSIQQRLDLLRGLMDSDGNVTGTGKGVEFTSTSHTLGYQVVELVQSLGGTATPTVKNTHYRKNGEKIECRPAVRLYIKLPSTMNPFYLERKATNFIPSDNELFRTVRKIEYEKTDYAQCITVEAENNLYVTENHIVTHNSYVAACLVLWFLDCWPENTIVYTIAPRKQQLENIWKHIEDLFPKFKDRWPDAQIMASKEIRMRGKNSEQKGSWKAEGFVAEVGAGEEIAGTARGAHAPNMLFIFDEANAIEPAIIKGLERTSTSPHNLKMYIGNPDHVNDALHQRFIRNSVVSVTVSALDHPNVVCDNSFLIQGATSKEFIESMIEECSMGGQDYRQHSDFLSRIRGICPVTSNKSLVPNICLNKVGEWLEANRSLITDHNPDYKQITHISARSPLLKGETRIYSLPDKVDTWINRYIISCDVASSEGRGDAHGCVVFDRVDSSISAVLHLRGGQDDYAKAIVDLAEYFVVHNAENNTLFYPFLVWETNGVGQLISQRHIQEYPSRHKYYKQNISKENPSPTEFPGWYTGQKERLEMQRAIESWGVRLLEFPDRVKDQELYSELQTLVYNDKKDRYEHLPGCHDDLAFTALGMAICVDNQLSASGSYPFKLERRIILPDFKPYMNYTNRGSGDMFSNMKLPNRL